MRVSRVTVSKSTLSDRKKTRMESWVHFNFRICRAREAHEETVVHSLTCMFGSGQVRIVGVFKAGPGKKNLIGRGLP